MMDGFEDRSDYKIKLDGLPEITFGGIEGVRPRPQPVTDVPKSITGCIELLAQDEDNPMYAPLDLWYHEALRAEPWREPSGTLVCGVEAWEFGPCVISTPRVYDEKELEIVVEHATRIHGYYFTCPHCGGAARPGDTRCNGATLADSVQCSACGVTSLVSELEKNGAA